MTEKQSARIQDRDTFVLGVERKAWVKERAARLGLGKSEYIRRLIDADREAEKKETQG
jgi:hypothetical protein